MPATAAPPTAATASAATAPPAAPAPAATGRATAAATAARRRHAAVTAAAAARPIAAPRRLTPLGLARPRRCSGLAIVAAAAGHPIGAIALTRAARPIGHRERGPTVADWNRARPVAREHGGLPDARARPDPAEPGVRDAGSGAILEVHAGAGPRPQPVHEQAARLVVEHGAAAVNERPVNEGPVREAHPEEEGVVEEWIVVELPEAAAVERVIVERVVARSEATVVRPVGIRPAPPVGGRVVVPVRPRRYDDVAGGVVVEVTVGHALHDIDERRFLVVTRLARVEHAVVPVVAAHELVELERRHRAGGDDQPRAVAVIHVERFAVAPAADLDGLAAAHEVVVGRIEREQHPDAPVGVGAQHHDVAVFARLDVDARLVAPLEVVVIEPDFDRWVVTRRRDGRRARGSGRGAEQREHQCEHHWAILYIPSPGATDQEACRFPIPIDVLR